MSTLEEKIALWRQQKHEVNEIDEPIRQMLTSARIGKLPAGTAVFHPHDDCERFLLVTEGSVKVTLLTPSGQEMLLYRVEPGETCVLTTTCLMSSKPYPAGGTTESKVTALLISRTAFDQTLAASDIFRRIVFAHLGQRFAEVIARIEMLKYADLDERLATELLRRRDGNEEILVTHNLLATEIDSSREVVSRHLKALEHQGLIQLGRGRIRLLDPDALNSLAQDSA